MPWWSSIHVKNISCHAVTSVCWLIFVMLILTFKHWIIQCFNKKELCWCSHRLAITQWLLAHFNIKYMIRISVNAYNNIVPVESPHLTKVATWKPLNLTFWFHYPSRYIWWSFLLSMNKVIAVVIPCNYVYTCIHAFPGGNHSKDNAVTVPQLQSSILSSSIQGFGNLSVTCIYI